MFSLVFLDHVRVLCREELRDIFTRRRALITFLLYLGMLLILIDGFLDVDRRVGDFLGDPNFGEKIEQILYHMQFLGTPDVVRQLLDWPLALVLYQVFSVIWYPTFVALASCDMISTDLSRGSLRYVMLRTSRLAYFLSKQLAHMSLYIFVQLVSIGILVFVCTTFSENLTLDECLRPAVTYLILFLPYLWFIVSTTQLVSSVSRRPFVALLKVQLLWVAFLSLVIWFPHLGLTWEAFYGLVVPFEEVGLRSVVTFCAWSLGFSLLGVLYFLRREI